MSVAKPMDTIQTEAFRLYMALGPKRTIPKLLVVCNDNGMNVTLRMLMRWQFQFKWTKLAVSSSAAVASRVQEEMEPILVDHAKRQLDMLHKLQDRFYRRLALDPDDPMLSPDERRRVIDPEFKDFAESVKLERLILGDPTERREDVTTSRVVVEFTQNELFAAAQQLAEKRYGLPPPKPVIEHDE